MQKTAYEIVSRDWSSDVCSSDLCRFDRLYIRKSTDENVKPVAFELSGIERVKGCDRFPSDHWAIIAHFSIKTET